MIIPENMRKITSNKMLQRVSVIQLSEILCELDLMGAFKNEPWESRESEKNYDESYTNGNESTVATI